ncbi:MAG: spinster family MFS transporter [Terriglobales bacterium]
MSYSAQQIRVLAVLTLVNFVNYIDRLIIFPLFSLIKVEFLLTDAQLGLLGSVFQFVHSPANVILGQVADRSSRVKVMTYGVLFWSGATFLSGLAGSYHWLLVARALVGVGEAAYAPAGSAQLTAIFPQRTRARVQGIFNAGMFVGGAAGLALGGLLAESIGWRPAFFVVGAPGFLLAIFLWRLPSPPLREHAERIPVLQLLRVPAFVAMLVSGWFATFAAQAYLTWGTEFARRYKGFTLAQAGVSLGAAVIVAGVLGVMTGAALADILAKRAAWARAAVVAAGFLIAAPLVWRALLTPSRAEFVALFALGSFFLSWYHGPVIAIIHDLIPDRAHATALGVAYFLINVSAPALAPWVVGKIADRAGLLAGMQVAVAAQVAGGLLYLVVIYFIHRDGLHHPVLDAYRTPPPGAAAESEG